MNPQNQKAGIRFALVVFLFFSFIFPPRLAAQAIRAEDIYNEAQKAIDEGRVGDAIISLDELVTKYKASPVLPSARYLLAFGYVLQGQYTGAIASLTELLKTPNLDPILKEQGTILLAQCYSGQTATKDTDAEKKELFSKAAEQYTKFLTEFPQSAFREDALNGRALAYFFLEKLDDAVKDLELSRKDYPKSMGRLDTVYLLGLVKATQGVIAEQAKKTDEAKAKFDEASKLFGEIVQDGSDIPLQNESLFQIAEIHFNQGNYEDALSDYRRIIPKSEVIEKQREKIGKIKDELRASVGDQGRFKAIQRYLNNEQMKLAQMEAKSDQNIDAAIKKATIYNIQQKLDESRVILNHFIPFLKGNQVQNAQYQLVLSYSQQGLMPQAEKAKADFFSKFGNVPEGDQFGLVFGYAYLNQGEHEKAAKAFQESIDMYGDKHRALPEILAGQAMVFRAQGKLKEAADVFIDYLTKNPSSELAQSVLFQLGTTQLEMKDYDSAIKTYRDYLSKYEEGQYRDDARMQIARALLDKTPADPKNYEQAIKELQDLLTKNPIPRTGALAYYFIGQTYEKLGKVPEAVKAYQDAVAKYPEERTSQICFYQVAMVYQKAKEYDKMITAFQEIIKKYPESDLAPQSAFAVARHFESQKKYAQARDQYVSLVSTYPDLAVAPDAQERIFYTYFDQAMAMGRYFSLSMDRREEYQKSINDAIQSQEVLLQKFPNSPKTGDALINIIKGKNALLTEKVISADEITKYLDALSTQFAQNQSLKAQILFTQAGLLQESGDQKKALEVFRKIMDENPDARLSADNLDHYARALLANEQYDDALAVYQRIMTEFAGSPRSLDKGVHGLGMVYYHQDKYDLADKQFTEMKTNYRWSPLLGDAIYYSGMVELKLGKNDEAIKIFEAVAGTRNATNESKGRALIGAGDAEAAKGDANKALGNYIKVTLFYEGLPHLAAEATFKSAQMNQKLGKPDEAKKLYDQLRTRYPQTTWAKEAP